MGHDDHYIELSRLMGINKIDAKLEKIAYGLFGSIARQIGKKIKKGFYYIVGKKYD